MPPDDLDWYVMQGSKNMSKLLEHEHVPQEDITPALHPPPLLATPVPSQDLVLVPETPVSALTPLTATTPPKVPSPSISVLDTPVIRTLPQVQDTSATPKASAMDILPTNIVSEAPVHTPSSQQIIQPIVPDAQMTDAQKA